MLLATSPENRQQVRRLLAVLNDQTPSNKAKPQTNAEVHERTSRLVRMVKSCTFLRFSCYTLA